MPDLRDQESSQLLLEARREPAAASLKMTIPVLGSGADMPGDHVRNEQLDVGYATAPITHPGAARVMQRKRR